MSLALILFTRVGNVIDAVVVFLVVWADDAVVDDQRAVEVRRQVTPYDEDALYEPIQREPSHNEVREVLHN